MPSSSAALIRAIGLSHLWLAAIILPAAAQSIQPEAGGKTDISQTGNQITIEGGYTSADGRNLFHSFEQFGLRADQIATFLTQPGIDTILGRVMGQQASYIDGLLRVRGSNANLWLMNPAGILFGPNAQLDLPGAFTATTATGIGFGNGWLQAFNSNDYGALGGEPSGFAFALDNPGIIVNQADLAVAPRQSITLVGGTVIQTGSLTAAEGDITIMAVPGQHQVQIHHSAMVLSLEIDALPAGMAATPHPFTPVSLPQLLTGGTPSSVSEITVLPDGAVRLSGADPVPVSPGTTLISGSLDVSGSEGGRLTALGARVGLLGAELTANGYSRGGTIHIGGARQGQATLPSAQATYIDAATTLQANATGGDGGQVIVWADDRTAFLGEISATGNPIFGQGGFVEVSGKTTLTFAGSVDLQAAPGALGTLLLDPRDITIAASASNPNPAVNTALPQILASDSFSPNDITINADTLESITAQVLLAATRDITLVDGLSLTFATTGNPASPGGDIRLQAGRHFTMDTSQFIRAPGRTVTIEAAGAVTLGDIRTYGPLDGDLDGSIAITGASIQAGDLNALRQTPPAIDGLGDNNLSRVYLESTAGDIVVDTILAGSGGIGINAARRFRAQDTFIMVAGFAGSNFTANTTSLVAASPTGDVTIQRGVPIDPNNTQAGIAIAVELLNPLSTEEFIVGANTGPGIVLPNQSSGTAGGILQVRPDRTIVTSFQNQAFLFDPTLDITATDNLSEQGLEATEATIRGGGDRRPPEDVCITIDHQDQNNQDQEPSEAIPCPNSEPDLLSDPAE